MKKTALITGASSGVGLALAEKMLEQGVFVTGVARGFAKLSDRPVDIDMLQCCVDLSDIDRLAARLTDDAGLNKAFDVLVLNAGYGRFGGIEQFSHKQIRHLVDTNLVSNLFLIKHFLPKMKVNGGGDIVLIGSESALQGGKSGAVYCATKFALRGLAQSLRADCSTANIRVILINPGAVDSDFFDDLNFKPQDGSDFVIPAESVATAILNALNQPRNVVCDEINLQPIKRSFQKKK